MTILLLLLFITKVNCFTLPELKKSNLCKSLNCLNNIDDNVCGLKEEGEGFRIKIFKNKCELLSYGCKVEKGKEYGITSSDYCDGLQLDIENLKFNTHEQPIPCKDIVCDNKYINTHICAVMNDKKGFRVRKFVSECELNKYNCLKKLNYVTYDIDCDDLDLDNESVENNTIKEKNNKHQNIIVVNGSMLEFEGDINNTIDKFFASTHYMKIPLKEVSLENKIWNETRRGRILKIAGPIKVFEPWIKIPKNKSSDRWHAPTLMSCYHRCPEKCPDTYAPVCGVPGVVSREPSLMFKNHCYMDKAQCKMFWEDKSYTSSTSAYVESSFMFCLGDELNGLYRFLPLVRTLQHMGRLKPKGLFKYRLRNLRFFNNFLQREPKIMG